MNNSSKNKYLLKNTIILSIGNFGSKFISFFLVPLYTNVLTTYEYGKIDLITILSTVVVPLITLNIQEAVLRFSMDKDKDKVEVLKTGTLIMIIAIVLSLLGIPILNMFDATKNYSFLLVLYMLTYISSHIYLCYIRGIEKLIDYSVISIIQTFLIAILNVIFLIPLKLGITGYILAYIISYFVTFSLCFIRGNVLKSINNYKIDKKIMINMVKYSVLLIPNSLMWWIMNSLDRVMVSSILNVESNGIYAVSYKIPTIIITFTTIFNQAWMFSAVKEKDSKDKNEYTNSIYSSLFSIVTNISLLLILLLKPIMSIYVGNDFYSSWIYTPPLIVGTVFLTLATFISNEYTANKDSLGFLKSSTIGALINLILNFILIPSIGIIGAAIATAISYISVFAYRIFDTKKYLKLQVIDKNKCLSLLLLLLSTILVYYDNYISYFVILFFYVIDIIIKKELIVKLFNKLIKTILRRKKHDM